MLRKPKRHQNPPLIVAPFCGQTKYSKTSLPAGLSWPWAAKDSNVSIADNITSRVIFMDVLFFDRITGTTRHGIHGSDTERWYRNCRGSPGEHTSRRSSTSRIE